MLLVRRSNRGENAPRTWDREGPHTSGVPIDQAPVVLCQSLIASRHFIDSVSMCSRSSSQVMTPSLADAYASLSKPEQPKQLQSTSSPAGTGQAPTFLHISIHIGVGSTASTSIASFFDTATRCFSDSAHASVEPRREKAETVITAAKQNRIAISYVRCVSGEQCARDA